MKNPVQYKKIEPGSAFHEKKDKNKKINLGGPSKRKPPKTKPANRAQAKAKSIAKRRKNNKYSKAISKCIEIAFLYENLFFISIEN
jgi:hypothetical protein